MWMVLRVPGLLRFEQRSKLGCKFLGTVSLPVQNKGQDSQAPNSLTDTGRGGKE